MDVQLKMCHATRDSGDLRAKYADFGARIWARRRAKVWFARRNARICAGFRNRQPIEDK
jgi:hypothetical protein